MNANIKKESKVKKVMEKFGKVWKKFWYLLWKDNSLKGWLFSIIFLFIFIKFIFFPFLGLVTGSSLPLAIVESCSMYHQGGIFSNFQEWWQDHETKYSQFDIEKEEFENFKFKRGLDKGDILLIIGAKPENIKLGDIIIFNAYQRNPIIHRVIEIKKENGKYFFSTIGDNNNGQLTFEKNINEDEIIGKAVFRIVPYIGWGKLIFFEARRPPSDRGFCKER